MFNQVLFYKLLTKYWESRIVQINQICRFDMTEGFNQEVHWRLRSDEYVANRCILDTFMDVGLI